MRLIFYQSINRLNRANFSQITVKNDEYFLDSLFQGKQSFVSGSACIGGDATVNVSVGCVIAPDIEKLEGFGIEYGGRSAYTEGVGIGLTITGLPTDSEHYYGGYVGFCEGVAADGHYSVTYNLPTIYPVEVMIDGYFLIHG